MHYYVIANQYVKYDSISFERLHLEIVTVLLGINKSKENIAGIYSELSTKVIASIFVKYFYNDLIVCMYYFCAQKKK